MDTLFEEKKEWQGLYLIKMQGTEDLPLHSSFWHCFVPAVPTTQIQGITLSVSSGLTGIVITSQIASWSRSPLNHPASFY